MHSAFVGLGANLGDPHAQLLDAVDAISRLPDTEVQAVSRFYRSAPMGPAQQPDYCNAVCRVATKLAPRVLLAALIDIERAVGRIRGSERWGPRLLDLDLLHVVDVAINEPGLRLPHPGLGERNFVLMPLAEIEPGLRIPGVGEVAALAGAIGRGGLRLWEKNSN
ncbi:MAG: 2-amino-4-hydroxy-6-hydroxymethyldihydropteridine diphosphokinase [Panacagrimonas sp.]